MYIEFARLRRVMIVILNMLFWDGPYETQLDKYCKELSHVLSTEGVFQIEWITIANSPRREMAGMCIN